MRHAKARDRLSAYLEHDLGESETSALEAHLAGCDACRAELEQLRATMASLSGLHRLRPPAEFSAKVEHRIHRRSAGRFFGQEPLLTRVPFEWISFVIIVMLLGVYLVLTMDTPRVETRPRPRPALRVRLIDAAAVPAAASGPRDAGASESRTDSR